jgi:hypothetical protein
MRSAPSNASAIEGRSSTGPLARWRIEANPGGTHGDWRHHDAPPSSSPSGRSCRRLRDQLAHVEHWIAPASTSRAPVISTPQFCRDPWCRARSLLGTKE